MAEQQAEQLDTGIVIERIYVKDISFEAPATPQIFRDEWEPSVDVQLHTKSEVLEHNTHEVVLAITVTVKLGEKIAFLIEVHEAGIFTLTGFNNAQLHHVLGAYCPEIIFPYVREVISDVVVRGGFPQLNLAPMNFEALYAQHMAQQQQQQQQQQSQTQQTSQKIH
jgi:preprotein translocase subunit SecB